MDVFHLTRCYVYSKSSQVTEQRDDCLVGCSASPAGSINTLTPINKLPPEILGVIPTYQEEQTLKDLVTVSSVCSYWRHTFLATPTLWTKLDGKGMEKTRALVKRSRALPIQLRAEGSPDPEVIEFLGAHSSRLEVVDLPKLEVRDRPLFTHGHLSRLLRPTPVLRDLCVETPGPEPVYTPVIIDGEFPSLQVLRLSGFPVSITNLSAPGLRELFLTRNHDLARTLDFLGSFPLLERLTLRLDLDLQRPAPSEIGRKVVLGKILQASFFHGFEILQYLSLPPGSEVKAIVDISLRHLDGTTNDYTRLLSQILDNLPMTYETDALSFHTMRGCRTLLLSGPKGRLEFITPEINDTTAYITLFRLFTRHSTESLRGLTISNIYVHPSNVGVISDFLKSLIGLRSLTMHQSFASRCLSALGTSYCLRLEDVLVQRPSPWLSDHIELLEFVRKRSEAGIPIQRLLAVNGFPAPLDPGDMERLRKHVKCVVWR